MNLPMDETLANVSLDISGRSYLVYHCELKRDTIGTFSCEMVEEFLRAFAFQAGITLHVNVFYGTNDHHKVEAIFKALGRALGQATQVIGDALPSTKAVSYTHLDVYKRQFRWCPGLCPRNCELYLLERWTFTRGFKERQH